MSNHLGVIRSVHVISQLMTHLTSCRVSLQPTPRFVLARYRVAKPEPQSRTTSKIETQSCWWGVACNINKPCNISW